MMYQSTRDSSKHITSAEAIVQGISADGGLFVPQSFPQVNREDLVRMSKETYAQRACFILSQYLTDFTADELQHCIHQAYETGKFTGESCAPLHALEPGVHLLELWHGPTCAFKDMALQLMPHLLSVSAKKVLGGKKILILVATSGDTGKAALEGFQDVPGIEILVFYPEYGVSNIQKLQMVTQRGENVGVCAIEGNFDDAQTGVKQLFGSSDLIRLLQRHDTVFSSANSINWGRLVPQIVYYFSAYCDLIAGGNIAAGDPVNFAVPTGNFGNILSAYYARQMGLPIRKLICASNANNVLTEFIETGIYDRNRVFHATISPSMDILISSNLERLLYDASGRNDQVVQTLFAALQQTGKYAVEPSLKAKINDLFAAGFCDDEQTKRTIGEVYAKHRYLCDPHTAVAVRVYQDYRDRTADQTPTVIVSTASPFKFSHSVLEAIGDAGGLDEFAQLEHLSSLSGMMVPAPLAKLQEQDVRFTKSVAPQGMEQAVLDFLAIQ